MRKIALYKVVAVVGVFSIFTSEPVIAGRGVKPVPPQHANPSNRIFGKDAPFGIEDLPQKSHLRTALENLPETAKQHAMSWLHEFSFPANDVDTLQVDQDGGIFYADTETPQPGAALLSAQGAAASALPPLEPFRLHSLPGAARQLYLDFDGHVITGTAWNSTYASLTAQPFDVDDSSGTFSNDELNRIHEIWHRIAEDYAPFNIDVTTEEPASFGPNVGRLLFTKNVDAYGLDMPSKSAGGVAYVNVFGSASYGYYSPALVYYNNLGPSHPPYMAEAGSHEFGHNAGLSHDGTSTVGYYSGLGSGYSSWAPIMGVGYYCNVTEWSKGEYPDANNPQDDILLIANKLTLKGDDHGNSPATASLLAVESDGSIFVTNPQNDPGNVDPSNKGVIEQKGDIDVFAFDAGAGTVNITATPAWAAFTRTGVSSLQWRGANLDVKATLYDDAGNIVTVAEPLDNTNAVVNAGVAAGRYYLAVTGVGNAAIPYSDYGSQGEFFITGNVPPATTADTTPPAPDPSWQTVPTAQSATAIAMASTIASDASGVVEYQFRCVAGGSGCVNSAWQNGTDYLLDGLAPGTAYTFQIIARDAFGNQTQPSVTASATTLNPSQNVAANDDNAVLNEDATATIPVLDNDSAPNGGTLTVSAAGPAAHGAVINNGASITYQPAANFNGSDSFTYTVSDGQGSAATATVNILVNPVNDTPVAVNDSATVRLRKTVSIKVLANDTDIDGDSLTIVSSTKGTVNGSSISYKGSAVGTDTFSYTISDGKGGVASATVTVTVTR